MLDTDLNHLPISEVFARTDAAKDKFVATQKEFYLLLAYLDRTRRYKEDEQYKGVSFGVFLDARYNMTLQQYTETRVVLFEYEDQAQRHGTGFVRKTIKKAGRKKAQAVFDDLDKAQSKRKTPLKVADKEKILKEHVVPKPEATKREQPRHDWEFAFKQAHRRAEALQVEVADLKEQKKVMLKENRKLTKAKEALEHQVADLKMAVQEAETMAAMYQEEVEAKERIITSLRIPGTTIPSNGWNPARTGARP